MPVAKVKSGNIITYTGTSAEVAQAISDDQWPIEKIIAIEYDGTNFVAFVRAL